MKTLSQLRLLTERTLRALHLKEAELRDIGGEPINIFLVEGPTLQVANRFFMMNRTFRVAYTLLEDQQFSLSLYEDTHGKAEQVKASSLPIPLQYGRDGNIYFDVVANGRYMVYGYVTSLPDYDRSSKEDIKFEYIPRTSSKGKMPPSPVPWVSMIPNIR